MEERWASALEAYLREMAARSGSRPTVYHYSLTARSFFKLHPDPDLVTERDVHAFLYRPVRGGKSPHPETVCGRLNPIRGYFIRLVKWGMVTSDPTAGLKRPPIPPSAPKARTGAEIKALLAAIKPTLAGTRLATERGTRDYAIILTATYTGLRRAEVLSLRAGALQGAWSTGSGNACAIVRCKGGKRRRISFPPPVVSAILDSLAARGLSLSDMPPDESIWGDLSPSAFRNLVVRYAKAAGLGHLSPHGLRHSCARIRFERRRDPEAVQRHLGHSRMSTTETYLRSIVPETDPHWTDIEDALNS